MGKNLIYVPECHSTNTLALELAAQPSITEGTVVVTNHQTAGRGQRGNSWEAAKGKNLTFSVILKPGFLTLKNQFFLNIFTSLAIRDFLCDKSDAIFKIKWPNDILLNGKKICGILIENQIRGSQVSTSILGIGLNINQEAFENLSATSLTLNTGREHSLPIELESVLTFLEARYLQLRQNNLDVLKSEYLQHLYLKGEEHRFVSNNTTFTGKISGIDEIGMLSVETSNGTRTFDVKEISYVR
jgi:BirA family biotin operon repressor/biotin-[acetyl-CoA-carboxylase] ligase